MIHGNISSDALVELAQNERELIAARRVSRLGPLDEAAAEERLKSSQRLTALGNASLRAEKHLHRHPASFQYRITEKFHSFMEKICDRFGLIWIR